jgi:methylated-DNA-[protein]-cysteine S-methyltransferase
MHYHVFETAHGFCAIAWTSSGVAGFRLPAKTVQAAEQNMRRRLPHAEVGAPPARIADTIKLAQRYFAGERIDFSTVQLDLTLRDEFLRRIYAAAREVTWGQTTTYGTLAKQLGFGPEIARDVGQAMARNPIPLIIPCHRVLAAGGKLGGFSAPGGSNTKEAMLALEGVHVGPPPSPQQSLGL